MVDDPHSILIGLYRESTLCKTISSSKHYIEKEIYLNRSKFTLKEEKSIEGNVIWRMFDNEKELSREEIVNLYTAANFLRQA